MSLGGLGAICDLILNNIFFTLHTCLMENNRNGCSLGIFFDVFLTLLSPFVILGYIVTSIFVNTQFSEVFQPRFPWHRGA